MRTRWLVIVLLVGGIFALGYRQTGREHGGGLGMDMHEPSAMTYEHLATALIAMRETEDSLVLGILMHSHAAARHHLHAAMEQTGSNRVRDLEAAATEITNIATEGDKQVQAVRQRLLKSGHHHHTDSETQEDYIFIDSREKKQLIELAGHVSRMGRDVSTEQLTDAVKQLDRIFASVTAAE